MGMVKISSTLRGIREMRSVIVTAAEEEIVPRFADAVQACKADGSIVTGTRHQ
jgi:hypothetical protein